MVDRTGTSGGDGNTGRTVPEPPETVTTDSRVVACDGDGPAGHPRVWLNMADSDFIDCPYCDRRFVLSSAEAG